jgi:hypothetical protein
LPQWQSDLTVIVLEMEEYSVYNLAGEADDDDEGHSK